MPSVQLRIFGQPVRAEAPTGPKRIRFDQALPFLYELDDRVIAISVEHRTDEPVSCHRGCSACCRAQPVPVTPPEAYALARLVEAMPEPRRTQVRDRFADRVSRLRAAGLDAPYLERDPELSAQRARAIARDYFQLGLVCPFLEDDACGIYDSRPFVCRQYLVTSPPAMCQDPFSNPVTPVKMTIAPASAMLRAVSAAMGKPQYSIPLVLALEFVRMRRQELEAAFPAEKVYGLVLEETFAKFAKDPDPAS